MNQHALIVENDSMQYTSLADQLQDAGWTVDRAEDKEDADYHVRQAREKKDMYAAIAIDLGLPPFSDDFDIGLLLINELRREPEYEDLPVLAYTSQGFSDYLKIAGALRQMLVLHTSFIYLRSLRIPFPQIMEQVRLGFVIYSNNPAGFLSSAVSKRPDPLDDELWKTVKAIVDFPTQAQAAKALNVATETIKTRLEKIRQILMDRQEIPIDATSKELKDWYNHNKICFVRE